MKSHRSHGKDTTWNDTNASYTTWGCSSIGRAPGFYPDGWGFDALQPHQGSVAQSAEHPVLTREVEGSMPSGSTTLF